MGAKKRIQKLPKAVVIKCPFCSENMRLKTELEKSLQVFNCAKCEQEIRTPITQCCIVCAFSGKKCPQSLYMEARVKGLEIR